MAEQDEKAAAEAGIITTEVACRVLMLTRQRLDQLAQDGWIARHAPGRWRLLDLVQGYIRFLRDDARRTSKSAADSRARDIKTREVELRIALRAGELIEHAEHVAILDELLGLFRSELAGLPARLSRDLVERRRIEQAVDAILARLSARAAERAEQLQASLAGAGAVAAHDAGPMGG